jgi:hypothetical protein
MSRFQYKETPYGANSDSTDKRANDDHPRGDRRLEVSGDGQFWCDHCKDRLVEITRREIEEGESEVPAA